jgi:hypothetical protein
MVHLREFQDNEVVEKNIEIIESAVQDLFGVKEALGWETDRKKFGICQVLRIQNPEFGISLKKSRLRERVLERLDLLNDP